MDGIPTQFRPLKRAFGEDSAASRESGIVFDFSLMEAYAEREAEAAAARTGGLRSLPSALGVDSWILASFGEDVAAAWEGSPPEGREDDLPAGGRPASFASMVAHDDPGASQRDLALFGQKGRVGAASRTWSRVAADLVVVLHHPT